MSLQPQKLYFEDLRKGTIFNGSPPVHITSDDIIRFAREFDPQPFHLSEQGGKESFFKELVASGWQTASTTMRMLVTGELQFEGGLIGTWGEISWPAPVRPGDQLQVKGEIGEMKRSLSQPGQGFVNIKTETTNQDGVVVQRMIARLMIKCRTV